MKILVMGGSGITGTAVRKLLADTNHVVDYSSRHHSDDPHHVTLDLNGPKAQVVDVLSRYDWVIACVGPFERILDKAAALCLEAGTNYIDVNDSIDAREAILALPARDAGVTVLTGAGLCPGLSTALMMSVPSERVTGIRAELTIGKGQPSGAAAVLSMMSTMYGGYRIMEDQKIQRRPHDPSAGHLAGYECPDIGAVRKIFPHVQDYSYFVAFEALSEEMLASLQRKRIFSLPVLSDWFAKKASTSVTKKALEANQPRPATLTITMMSDSDVSTATLSGLTSYDFTALAAASTVRFVASREMKPGAYEVADVPELAAYLLEKCRAAGAQITTSNEGEA